MSRPLSPSYLRTQAARCQRLSRACMDLDIARDLRLMADEYLAEANTLEQQQRSGERSDAAQGQSRSANGQSHLAFPARNRPPEQPDHY